MAMTIERIGEFPDKGALDRAQNVEILEAPGTLATPATPTLPEGKGGFEPPARSFGEMLTRSIEKVNDIQNQADRAVKELVAGRDKNIHETMLMMEKADMSFRMLMQVRNKVLEAYREVMRMQV